MVNLASIRAARDIASLKEAVVAAFAGLTMERANTVKIADLETRIKNLEGTV
ncbi:hypothetical protein ES703_51740 [subsurface metagenome]